MCAKELAETAISRVTSKFSDQSSHLGLHPSDILQIFEAAFKHLSTQPAVLSMYGQYTIVGDLHGSFESLISIFSRNGYPEEDNKYIFLGDYVDRGTFGLEVIILLFSYQILYPASVVLLRGNHETPSMTYQYGFRNECITRGVESCYIPALKVFDELPLAAIINDSVFCVHGGISPSIQSTEQLFALSKPQMLCESEMYNQAPYSTISPTVIEFLWSDPSPNVQGIAPSNRGCGNYFGEDVLFSFLANLKIALVVRAHEACKKGYMYNFQSQRILTIFSAINYCGLHNIGAYLTFSSSGAKIETIMPNITPEKTKKRFLIPNLALSQYAERSLFQYAERSLIDVY